MADPLKDLAHVRQILEGADIIKSTVDTYIGAWKRWIAWCDGNGVNPSPARRDDVDRYASRVIPRPTSDRSRATTRRLISAVYAHVKPGGPNPAQRKREITAFTRHEYEKSFRVWSGWCEKRVSTPLPADPDALAEYLAYVGGRRAVSRVRRDLLAISRAHTENDFADPTLTAPSSG